MRSALPFLAFVFLASTVGCAADGRRLSVDDDDPASDVAPVATEAELIDLATTPAERSGPARDANLTCGDGAHFDSDSALCVDASGNAVGPFPEGMRDACRSAGGGPVCETDSWPLPLARAARNAGATTDDFDLLQSEENLCPTGTHIHARSGLCTDDAFVYAPVAEYARQNCVDLGGGKACSGARFPVEFTKDVILYLEALRGEGGDLSTQKWAAPKGDSKTIEAPSEACGDSAKLVAAYKKKYPVILDAGRAWGERNPSPKTGKPTKALCATDASYALDEIYPGFSKTRGYNLHRVDGVGADGPGFREALEAKQWQHVSKDRCQAGDFAFTTEGGPGGSGPAPENPKVNSWDTRNAAHSAHVYMVSDNNGGALSAVDNQGANYVRNGLKPAFCMRAPGVQQGCGDFDCQGKADGNYCGKIGAIFNVVHCVGGTRRETLQCATTKTCTKGPVAAGDLITVTKSVCK
jgi:hypothetical protein